ncbi:MAG: sigma-70 family RNA polymerase sigma factor [Bryobacteraceae bacterium]|nr:sigma-70 family RNA polymerase sigma factor [Bryobacteraceae bacterium]
MQAELPHACVSGPRELLWVSPIDDRGNSVDLAFLEAAERIGADFFLYRAREMNDPSRMLELAERAVHCASRAKKKRPVDDVVAYLFRTFTHMVDHDLDRARRFLSLSDELLHAIGRLRPGDVQEQFDRKIAWRELLDSVDEETKWILWRLYWGFSIDEIAAELSIPPNTLSQRLSRLRKKLKKVLDRQGSAETRSMVDETRLAPRNEPERAIRPPGKNRRRRSS